MCVDVRNYQFAFTWLGKLLNTAISQGLSGTGIAAAAGPFCLRLGIADLSEVIPAFQKAVKEVERKNPFGQVDLSRLIDLGPHFDNLPQDLQQLAREDWLPTDFLTGWAASLTQAIRVAPESELGQDLLSLI
jgi:hypothetical protein